MEMTSQNPHPHLEHSKENKIDQEYLATVIIVATLIKDLGYVENALEVLENVHNELGNKAPFKNECARKFYVKYLHQKSNCLELLGQHKEALDVQNELAQYQ